MNSRRKSTKGCLAFNVNIRAKTKHLFLNEDDVDTYITYPPKDDTHVD